MARAYLLAAGRGRRSGGPKAWLKHQGKTLLERHASFLLQRFKPEAVAISIQPEWLSRCLSISPSIRWVPVDPKAAPLASLIKLFEASPPKDWSFVYHVDMPVWDHALFDRLSTETASSTGQAAVVPVYQGKKGHPVVLSPETGPALMILDTRQERLDHWLRSQLVKHVDVPFPAILENWNLPIPS